MSAKGDELLRKMLEYSLKLQDYVNRHQLTPEILGMNSDYQWAVVTPLVVIGETASRLQRIGETAGPEIRLGDIAGLRNRLAHDYDGTDWNVVNEVVFQDIPVLVEQLKAELCRRSSDCESN